MRNDAEIFRELAPLLRVRPELQQICRFGAQWVSEHEPEAGGWAPFHIVTFGVCLLDVGERVGIRLEAGDAAVLPHGGPHTVRALPTAAGPTSAVRIQRRLHDELVVKSNVDGEPDTKLICGRLCFEHAHHNMVLMALPAVVVLGASAGRDAGRLRRIVEAIQAELEEDRLGAATVAASLASSLMMFVLRTHFESELADQSVLALLARRQTAKALAAMLMEPARDWTLDELAKRANASRATLVRLFRNAVDVPPHGFLAELRLSLARHRVLATNTPLTVIAEEVGYQSDTAFSRAYHRRFGIAPGADRRGLANVDDTRRGPETTPQV
jgi:AraC family transcriptional activator of mtrCDE